MRLVFGVMLMSGIFVVAACGKDTMNNRSFKQTSAESNETVQPDQMKDLNPDASSFVSEESGMPANEQESILKSAFAKVQSGQQESESALSLSDKDKNILSAAKSKAVSSVSKRATNLANKLPKNRGLGLSGSYVVGYVGVGGAVLTLYGVCAIEKIMQLNSDFTVSILSNESFNSGSCTNTSYLEYGAGLVGIGLAVPGVPYSAGIAGIATSPTGLCVGGAVTAPGYFYPVPVGACTNWP